EDPPPASVQSSRWIRVCLVQLQCVWGPRADGVPKPVQPLERFSYPEDIRRPRRECRLCQKVFSTRVPSQFILDAVSLYLREGTAEFSSIKLLYLHATQMTRCRRPR